MIYGKKDGQIPRLFNNICPDLTKFWGLPNEILLKEQIPWSGPLFLKKYWTSIALEAFSLTVNPFGNTFHLVVLKYPKKLGWNLSRIWMRLRHSFNTFITTTGA
jgi:hypothetical protein